MNKNVEMFYPGFDYKGNELSAFTFAVDTFTISLKNGNIINYKPDNAEKFRQWLTKNNVRNITASN